MLSLPPSPPCPQVLRDKGHSSAAVSRRLGSKWPRPEWHAPWRLYRVISGHLGWVRSIAFDPSNEWFATGSSDRTIKLWDLASGQLKLTLTGHIEQVGPRGAGAGLHASERRAGLERLLPAARGLPRAEGGVSSI